MRANNLTVTIPVAIGAAEMVSSSIPEPDASSGEIEWVSGAAYAVGDVRVISTLHKRYRAYGAVTSTTPPNLDPTHWNDIGATNRFRAFDSTGVTQSTASSGTITFSLLVNNIDSIQFMNLTGCSSISVSAVLSNGTNYFSKTINTFSNPFDWKDYWFGTYPRKAITASFELPYRARGVTVTITLSGGSNLGVGVIMLGAKSDLLGDSRTGVQDGSVVYSQSDSRVQITDDYGNSKKVGANIGNDLEFMVIIDDMVVANSFASIINDLAAKDIAAHWQIKYAGYNQFLNIIGTVSGKINPTLTHIQANLKITGVK